MNYKDYYLHLTEAFTNKNEFHNALNKSELEYVSVELDKHGKIYFSPDFDNQVSFNDRRAYVILEFNKTTVVVKDHPIGNRINAGLQQLLQQLKKDDIINSKWTVSFKDDEGLYKQGKYTHIDSTFDKLPVSHWTRSKRINLGKDLVLYHGTSSKDLPTIIKYGLQPLGRKYTTSGSSSRIRTDENKNFLYLATDFRGAYRYAKDRARDQMRKFHPDNWDYLQYREVEYWDIQPVVLEITVPDFTKLKSDDDRVIGIMKDMARKFWDSFSPDIQHQEWEATKIWFNKNAGFTPRESDKGSYYWIMSDNGLKYVLDRLNKNEWNNWKDSIQSNQQVAYDGFIPSQYLKIKSL